MEGAPASPSPTPDALGTASPTPFAPPASPRPGRSPSHRNQWIALGAVIAVAIVIVGVLALSGVFSTSGGSSTGVTESYASAVGPAGTAAGSAPDGPWTIVAAVGVGIPSSTSESNTAGLIGTGCTFTPETGTPTTLTIPGTASDAPVGTFALWVFFATNGLANTTLLVVVVGTSAGAIGVATGSCVSDFNGLSAISATDVNSTTIGASFDSASGSAFLSGNAVMTKLFLLIGASADTANRPVWEAEYSTCAFDATGGTGTEDYAFYYADTGTLVEGPITTSVNCANG
jgi:hypothetical protein